MIGRKNAGLRKHLCYIAIFLLLYVLQGTPRFLEIGQVKPLLLFSAAIAAAMFEGEFTGGLYGAFAGLLCDTLGFGLFGFNGFLLCLVCIIIGLLVELIMLATLATYIVYLAGSIMAIYSLHFIFSFGIWRLPSLERLYFQKVVLVALYTVVLSPLFYYWFRWLYSKFYHAAKGFSEAQR